MNILGTKKDDSIFQLSSRILSQTDSVQAFLLVRRLLVDLVPCDAVLLLVGDQSAGNLQALEKYNQDSSLPYLPEISYKDPVVDFIFREKKIFTREMAEDPLVTSMKAEVFVPLHSSDDEYGFIYIARTYLERFSHDELLLLENIAAGLSIVFERQKYQFSFKQLQGVVDKWQQKYYALLEGFKFPALIVDLENDSVKDINDSAIALFNVEQDKLFTIPFSKICKFPDLKNGKKAEFKSPVELYTTGQVKNVQAVFSRIGGQESSEYFVNFLLPQEGSDTEFSNWLNDFQSLCKDITYSPNFGNVLKKPLKSMLSYWGAKYLTFQQFNANDHPKPVLGLQQDGSENTGLNDFLYFSLNSGPFQQFPDQAKSIFIDDVSKQKEQHEWQVVAERCGISSYVRLPILSEDDEKSIVNLYFADKTSWDTRQIEIFESIRKSLQELSKRYTALSELSSYQNQIQAVKQFLSSTSSGGNIKDIVLNSADTLNQFVEFDCLVVTVFDNKQIPASYELCQKSVSLHLDRSYQRKAIEKSLFGWVQTELNIENESSENGVSDIRPKSLLYKMPVNKTFLLMQNERFLGSLSLGRVEENSFSVNDIKTVEYFCVHLAQFLDKSKEHPHGKKFVEIDTLTRLLEKTAQSENLDDVLKQIQSGFAGLMDADFDHIVTLTDQKLRLKQLNWLSEPLREAISEKEIKILSDFMLTSHTPVYFPDISFFKDKIGKPELNIKTELFSPFIIAPVFFSDIARYYLVAGWQHSPDENIDLNLVQGFVRFVEKLFLNKNLYAGIQEQNEQLEQFVYTVSHDLKTPIQTIKSFSELLKEELGDEISNDAQKYLERMNANLDQMNRLILDLLEFSRIGRVDSNFEPVDINEIVDQVVQSFSVLLDKNNIELEILKKLPEITAVSTGIYQVFSNLISNALKFSKSANKPKITIDYSEIPGFYEFSVADNGCGVPKELSTKVFELFRTQNGDMNQEGTGVGLAIVKKIIEFHNGKVWVEERSGGGADFRFTIQKK